MRRDCPQRQGSRCLGLVQSQSAVGQEQLQLVSPYPSMGQRDQYQSEDATLALSTSRTGPHRPGSERRSRSTIGFAGREFRSGWTDDVLPLQPAWTYEARLSSEAEISWYRD